MEPTLEADADHHRALLCGGDVASFRRRLSGLPSLDRDAWVDRVLGFSELPDDGPALPRDGVAYLPAPVALLQRAVELAKLGPDDLIVDVGAGIGRAALVLHLLSGARVRGVEIQPQLVAQGRRVLDAVGRSAVSLVEGDATQADADATAFFLYCPFDQGRLARWLESLRGRAAVRIAAIDLPFPRLAWLEQLGSEDGLTVWRSCAGG